jgi:hypothetical protein
MNFRVAARRRKSNACGVSEVSYEFSSCGASPEKRGRLVKPLHPTLIADR